MLIKMTFSPRDRSGGTSSSWRRKPWPCGFRMVQKRFWLEIWPKKRVASLDPQNGTPWESSYGFCKGFGISAPASWLEGGGHFGGSNFGSPLCPRGLIFRIPWGPFW